MSENPINATAFVQQVLFRCAVSRGAAANLRRADNPGTEHYSWGILADLGVDIEKEAQYLPCALVAASLARLRAPEGEQARDGNADLGAALSACYPDRETSKDETRNKDKESGSERHPANARLHRLLTCSRLEELCLVLRPMLRLVSEKTTQPLCHAKLLEDLQNFATSGEAIKRRWAHHFYHRPGPAPEDPLAMPGEDDTEDFAPAEKGEA